MDKNLPILKAKGLTKILGGRPVVSNLSFSVYPGEIYGFWDLTGQAKRLR